MHQSQDATVLVGVDGSPQARIQLAPRLLAQMAVNQVRASADGIAPPAELFGQAADIFEHQDVLEESPQQYCERVALTAGLPIAVVRKAMAGLAESMRDITRINNRDFSSETVLHGGRVVLGSAGRLFASVASAGKHPGPNGVWLRALSLGFSVLVRPGHRDPFTARRLAAALLAVGLAKHKITMLSGDDDMAQLLIRSADRSVLFGPEEKVRPLRSRRDVQVHGVGRSKALIDHEPDADELDFLVESVAGEAGVRCDCTSVILTTGDPAALAAALANKLAERVCEVVTNDTAQLPVVGAEVADGVRAQLAGLSEGLIDHSTPRYGGDPLQKLADGSYAVRPIVLSTSDGTHPSVGIELVSPFVVVVPWRPSDGVAPLRDSLFLTLLTDNEELLAAAVAEPSVGDIIAGPVLPWATHASVPEPLLTRLLTMEKRIFTRGARS